MVLSLRKSAAATSLLALSIHRDLEPGCVMPEKSAPDLGKCRVSKPIFRSSRGAPSLAKLVAKDRSHPEESISELDEMAGKRLCSCGAPGETRIPNLLIRRGDAPYSWLVSRRFARHHSHQTGRLRWRRASVRG